jgi:hypothetical protein
LAHFVHLLLFDQVSLSPAGVANLSGKLQNRGRIPPMVGAGPNRG